MPVSQPSPVEAVPSLEPGDRLTGAEFERRYNAMPNCKKAELIEGVVYMPSRISLLRHGSPHLELITWLGMYEAATPCALAGLNSTIRLDMDNEPQPDALLMIDPACGGQATISDDDYVENAPELVGEVSASSVSFDVHTKLTVYRRNKVREYLVWRVLDRKVDWFVSRAGVFEPLAPDESGRFRSETFLGLWLDADALIGGDMLRVLALLQLGISSPEHAAFIERCTTHGKQQKS